MASNERKPVPKFSSFKSRPKPAIQTADSDARVSTEATHSSRPAEAQSSSRHRSANSRPADASKLPEHAQKHRIPFNKPAHIEAQQPAFTKQEHHISDEFMVDVRGDAQNVEFGTLHRYSVPSYFRAGGRRVIGAPSRLMIGNESSTTSKEAILETKRYLKTAEDRALLHKRVPAKASKEKRIVPQPDAIASRDYISLKGASSRKAHQDNSPELGTEHGVPRHRTLLVDPADDASSDDSDVESDERATASKPHGDHTSDLHREHATLLRSTRTSPHTIENWLQLAALQTRVVQAEGSVDVFTDRQKRVVAEVKVSIYNDALKRISKDVPGRERLQIVLMKESRIFKDSASMSKSWNDMLQLEPRSPALWTAYLDFIQSEHATFNFDDCKAAFVRCLTILHDAASTKDSGTGDTLESIQLFVWLRYTSFVRDSGYEELSTAMWQCLFQMILAKEDDMSKLEHLWESQLPRVGEEPMKGAARDDSKVDHGMNETQQVHVCHSMSKFVEMEAQACARFVLPAAADDGDAMDDPYRVVLFSDIQDSVLTMNRLSIDERIVDAFLLFWNLPMTASYSSATKSRKWLLDPLLRTQDRDYAVLQNTYISTWSLFEPSCELLDVSSYNESERAKMLRFVDLVLSRLAVDDRFGVAVTEYHIALKSKYFPQEVTKLARLHLKRSPSNLRLYNAYALAQMRLGHIDKAREIWSMASALEESLDFRDRPLIILLIHSRTLTEICTGDDVAALRSLLCVKLEHSGDIDGLLTPVIKVKTQRSFQQGWVDCLDRGAYDLALLYAECQSFLTYFFAKYDLEAAVSKFSEHAEALTRRSTTPALEGLHEAQLRLIKWHLDRHRPYKQALLRDTMRTSISLFPSNTNFLRMYAKHDIRISLDDRVRASMREQIAQDARATVITWSFILSRAIDHYRQNIPGHTEHSVRNTFTKALTTADSPVRNSPALWMLWLGFEYGMVKQNLLTLTTPDRRHLTERLRQTVLGGSRHLPWHKGWMIYGMKLLARNSAMEEAELRQLYDMMVNRSLRIRVELDDAR